MQILKLSLILFIIYRIGRHIQETVWQYLLIAGSESESESEYNRISYWAKQLIWWSKPTECIRIILGNLYLHFEIFVVWVGWWWWSEGDFHISQWIKINLQTNLFTKMKWIYFHIQASCPDHPEEHSGNKKSPRNLEWQGEHSGVHAGRVSMIGGVRWPASKAENSLNY